MNTKPTNAFVMLSWGVLITGITGFLIGLWNAASLELDEKGFYFTVLMFGLFAAVSVQKSVRDKAEGIPVTDIYYGLSWFATIMAVLLLVIGLYNATIPLSEKGFYGMTFTLAMFAAIAVQKNTRDLALSGESGSSLTNSIKSGFRWGESVADQ